MRDLTLKQQLFVQEYLVSLNATQAALKAGYSPKTAAVMGSENLRKPYIAALVEEAMEARAERTRVDADKVVKELAKLGFSDMREIAAWGRSGLSWKESEELEDEAAACVQEVKYTHEVRYTSNGERIETDNMGVKLHDKKAALKMLGDHLGLFVPSDVEVERLADAFMSGVHTVKSMAVEDKSE